MELDDASFLAAAGITPDYTWLIEHTTAGTAEQQQFILSLLRLNSILGGGLTLTLPSMREKID